MLWVKISVNNVPFKAFVDSGAQMSIMSKRAVDDANLSNLVDTRFSGVARGVGEQRIRGRVHQAPITVGETYLPCAIHVLDNQSIDVIFGLDMLMRHQCNIDLKHQKLIVGTTGAECAFLGEAEIPKDSPGNESTPHDEQQQQQRQNGAASSRQSPQQAPQTSHQQQQEVDAEKVARLAGLGFNEQQAREALKQAGGNVEIAAGLLFGG
jgi:DNA damage-inducible protein 1